MAPDQRRSLSIFYSQYLSTRFVVGNSIEVREALLLIWGEFESFVPQKNKQIGTELHKRS